MVIYRDDVFIVSIVAVCEMLHLRSVDKKQTTCQIHQKTQMQLDDPPL